VVVLLILMAAAVQRGTAAFPTTYALNAAADAVWEAAYPWRHRAHALIAWKGARSPLNLLRQLRSDRHLPATDEDGRLLVDGSPDLDVEWARAASYWLAIAIAAVAAALLAGAVGQSPALANSGELRLAGCGHGRGRL
jgi:hypothetical protein